MRERTPVVELHLHTDASDGRSSVSDRISQALDRGVDAIAISDHEVILPDLVERVESRRGVTVISGVEIRADISDTKVEVLGYFVDPTDDALGDMLARARSFRRERNQEIVEELSQEASIDLDYEGLVEEVQGELGRPHLASKLFEAGVVDTISDAFDEYLAESGSSFVPMNRHDHDDVIDAIHGAGGVASLAHPGRIRRSREAVERILSDLVAAGLDAIEVRYPDDADRSTAFADIDVAAAEGLCVSYDLLPTGGSDCHGIRSGKFRIGTVGVDQETLEAIEERAHEIQSAQ